MKMKLTIFISLVSLFTISKNSVDNIICNRIMNFIFSKVSILLVFIFSLFIFSTISNGQSLSYKLVSFNDVKHELTGNNYPNILKTYDMAIDQFRNRAYVTSILTQYVGVIDLNTKTEIGSVIYPFSGAFLLTTVSVNPANGYLVLSWTDESPVKQYLVNPENNQLMGNYTYQMMKSNVAFDSLRNRILIGDGPLLKIFNGNDLSFVNSINFGSTIGSAAVDSACRFVYISKRSLTMGNINLIKKYSLTAPYPVIDTINVTFDYPLGVIDIDSARQKLLMKGSNYVVAADIITGDTLNSRFFSSPPTGSAYDRKTQLFYLINPTGYSAEGEGGAWGKLYIYNTLTRDLDSIKKGDKNHTLQIHKNSEKLVWPDMHSGYLEMFDTETGGMDSVHFAVSLDNLDHSPNGNNVFIVSRLGGSDILNYNVSTKTFTKFKAGNWPSVVKVDSSTNRLYVYNHFQSSISVFNATDNTLVTTIELPILEGRTDEIPTMEIDRLNKKLYAAVPEYKKLCVIDMPTDSVVRTIDLPDLDSSDGGGIGHLQTMPVQDFNKLYVLYKLQKRLKIYNTSTFTTPITLNLGPRWSDTTAIMDENAMYYDSISNRMFVGNIIINTQTNVILGTVLNSSHIVGYKNDRSKLYGMIIKNDTVKINEYIPQALNNVVSTKILFKRHSYVPNFDYDVNKNDLYIGEFNYGLFRHYDLDINEFQLRLIALIQGFYYPTGDTLIADTAKIYLRYATTPFTFADSSKGVLDSSGTSLFNFSNAINDTPYYLVIKHRNSIETWSKLGVSFSSGVLMYDFTTSANKAHGNNMIQVNTSPKRFAIYNGDVNQDGIVDASDAAIIDNDASIFTTGYVSSDLTGDGTVDGSDAVIADNNAFSFVSLVRP